MCFSEDWRYQFTLANNFRMPIGCVIVTDVYIEIFYSIKSKSCYNMQLSFL